MFYLHASSITLSRYPLSTLTQGRLPEILDQDHRIFGNKLQRTANPTSFHRWGKWSSARVCWPELSSSWSSHQQGHQSPVPATAPLPPRAAQEFRAKGCRARNELALPRMGWNQAANECEAGEPLYVHAANLKSQSTLQLTCTSCHVSCHYHRQLFQTSPL